MKGGLNNDADRGECSSVMERRRHNDARCETEESKRNRHVWIGERAGVVFFYSPFLPFSRHMTARQSLARRHIIVASLIQNSRASKLARIALEVRFPARPDSPARRGRLVPTVRFIGTRDQLNGRARGSGTTTTTPRAFMLFLLGSANGATDTSSHPRQSAYLRLHLPFIAKRSNTRSAGQKTFREKNYRPSSC